MQTGGIFVGKHVQNNKDRPESSLYLKHYNALVYNLSFRITMQRSNITRLDEPHIRQLVLSHRELCDILFNLGLQNG